MDTTEMIAGFVLGGVMMVATNFHWGRWAVAILTALVYAAVTHG